MYQGGPGWDRAARRDALKAATTQLLDATGRDPERLQRAVAAVVPLLVARHRASSAIENLNSVLRPFLANGGATREPSAYEGLTGAPVADGLTLLGYPPGKATAEA